jgi:hypothetical protein
MQSEAFYINAFNNHYYGSGWSWGSFEYALLNLLEHADLHNIDKLSEVFPNFVSAFVAVQRGEQHPVPDDTPMFHDYYGG